MKFNKIYGLVVALLVLVVVGAFVAWSWPVAAQVPDTDEATFTSASGDSAIFSQRVEFGVDKFAASGTLENLQVTPAGLVLANGASEGVYVTNAVMSPLDFTTDIAPAWLADLPDGAAVVVEARLSSDGENWQEWLPVPVEFYPTAKGEYAGVLVWVNQAATVAQFKVTLQAGADGASPVFQRLRLFFNDTPRIKKGGLVWPTQLRSMK